MAQNQINYITNILLTELQKQPIYYNLPPYSRILVDKAVTEVANKTAININQNVQTYSNKQITENKNNIVGPYNQFNVVNNNINSTQLSNRLLPNATSQLLGSLTNDMVFNLVKSVNDKLPASLRSTLNLNRLTEIFTGVAGTAVGKGITSSVSNYSNQLLSGNFKVGSVLGDLNNLLGGSGVFNGDFTQINKKYDGSITNKALSEAKNFNINNPTNKEKLIVNTKGFTDPTATYPTKEYKGQSDTNKLARGIVQGTIVQQKEDERVKGIQLPRGQYFEEPPQSFKGQYPYNKVNETESGHIIEIDDTEGAERLHVFHKAGTYIEIDPNGSMVRRIKGSNYEIIDKNGYVSITGDCNISVKGSSKIYVGNDAEIEVEGDVNVNCYNDVTVQAAGKMNLSATEELNIHSGNVNIEADFNINMKSDANVYLATGNVFLKSNHDIYTEVLENNHLTVKKKNYTNVTEDYHIKVGEKFYATSGGDTHWKSSGSIYNQASSAVHFKSGGSFNVDGSATYLQSGTAASATSSTAALTSKYAVGANVGFFGVVYDPNMRPTRKVVSYDTIPDPISANYIDALSESGEDSISSENASRSKQNLRNKGAGPVDEKGVTIETDNPSSSVSTIILPDKELLKATRLPDNYNLSKHFTLGMVSSKAAVSKYSVTAQGGLTYGQIVYNLAILCLNVLEPALALYPNLVVTSGFRTADACSNPTSQHQKGQAVDFQIPSIGPKNKLEYFEVAKKICNNVIYDQFLLEYKTTGTGMPWIHVSLSDKGNRKQVLTLLNDQKYASGLAKVVV